jgi:glycerol-3-phosphate cytidylyltransferase
VNNIISKKKYATVITYGTYDMFHVGHLNLLLRLKEEADQLIVGVSSDEFNLQKGKKTLIPYEQRAKIIQHLECVDIVIPECSWEQKIQDIEKYDVDLFAIGDDWQGEFDYLSNFCQVKYLARTENISTTQLKKSLTSFLSIPKEDILNAFDILAQLKVDLE